MKTTTNERKQMKLKDLLRYLLLIEVNKDFNSIPVIKINQNFDLLKLNRKEII
jgi:hypothetical protein|tara:strand:+ start:63 stop:221 length:159 start_codon:yes stop_codon:yes gene_type:complete